MEKPTGPQDNILYPFVSILFEIVIPSHGDNIFY